MCVKSYLCTCPFPGVCAIPNYETQMCTEVPCPLGSESSCFQSYHTTSGSLLPSSQSPWAPGWSTAMLAYCLLAKKSAQISSSEGIALAHRCGGIQTWNTSPFPLTSLTIVPMMMCAANVPELLGHCRAVFCYFCCCCCHYFLIFPRGLALFSPSSSRSSLSLASSLTTLSQKATPLLHRSWEEFIIQRNVATYAFLHIPRLIRFTDDHGPWGPNLTSGSPEPTVSYRIQRDAFSKVPWRKASNRSHRKLWNMSCSSELPDLGPISYWANPTSSGRDFLPSAPTEKTVPEVHGLLLAKKNSRFSSLEAWGAVKGL